MVEYLADHRVEDGGRYQLGGCMKDDSEPDPDRFAVIVYSHPWSFPSLKAEATMVCGFRFDLGLPGIEYLRGAPGFDLDTAWAELATIEQAALGTTIHGRPRPRPCRRGVR